MIKAEPLFKCGANKSTKSNSGYIAIPAVHQINNFMHIRFVFSPAADTSFLFQK